MRRVTLLVLTLILVGAAAASFAAPRPGGRWHKLGSRTVTDKVDHDVIIVGAKRGQWQAIKILVKKRPVQFRSVVVHFANGKEQEVELAKVIPAGASSRIIDLNGGKRTITKVEFLYDAQSLGAKAVVTVLGRR